MHTSLIQPHIIVEPNKRYINVDAHQREFKSKVRFVSLKSRYSRSEIKGEQGMLHRNFIFGVKLCVDAYQKFISATSLGTWPSLLDWYKLCQSTLKYFHSYRAVWDFSPFQVQSNLDYSKCQGPPDFLRIIDSSNLRNRYFSEMFGSFRSVLIFDCISIKNGEQVSYRTFENKAKQSDMNLLVFFVLFTSRATT